METVARSFDPNSAEYRLGQRIHDLREKKSISQTQLAALVGIDRSAVSNYENGTKGEMGFKTLLRFADALHVTTNDLLCEDSKEELDFSLLNSENRELISTMYDALCIKQGIKK